MLEIVSRFKGKQTTSYSTLAVLLAVLSAFASWYNCLRGFVVHEVSKEISTHFTD
jgi:hypothetical protein